MVEKEDLLHIHLLNCVHKYRAIYDGIGLLVLKGAVVVEGLIYIHVLMYCVHKYTDIYNGAVL